tara:strand:+ start:334 stop:531 length:198 start_codon:yes stop_codon:yes gene_type:complete
MELIDFQDKKWIVKAKVHESQVEDHTKLKAIYGADLVLKSNKYYFIVDAVIDAEFEEIKDNKEKK